MAWLVLLFSCALFPFLSALLFRNNNTNCLHTSTLALALYFRESLHAELRGQYETWVMKNEEASMAFCSQLLDLMHNQMQQEQQQQQQPSSISHSDTDTSSPDTHDLGLEALEKYKCGLDTMLLAYYERARGPLQDAAVCNFIGGPAMEHFVRWGERASRMHAAEINAMQQEINKVIKRHTRLVM